MNYFFVDVLFLQSSKVFSSITVATNGRTNHTGNSGIEGEGVSEGKDFWVGCSVGEGEGVELGVGVIVVVGL